MRRSRRRCHPLVHVLIAGAAEDIDAIRQVVALLPADAFGQVYVESDPLAVLPDLTVPHRVTVNHLRRSGPEVAVIGGGAEPGALLAGAVAAWTAEWMPEETDEDRELQIWTSGQVGRHLAAQCLSSPR